MVNKGTILLLLIVFYQLISLLPQLSVRYDTLYWESQFSRSQLIYGGKAEVKLSDYDLYSIVGYKYWRGDDPMRLHPEVPPLGKQIIGLSIILFQNPAVINVFLGFSVLVIFYLISRQISLSPFVSSLGVFLISLDPLFRESITTANLDIIQLFFLSLSLLSFLIAHRHASLFALTSIAIGLIMTVKFYLTGLFLLWIYLGYLFFRQDFQLFKKFIYSLPYVLLGYVLPYAPSLIANPDIISFLRFQRWLTSWWAGNARAPWGGIFHILITGRWYTWWEGRGIVPIPQWTLAWPIFSVIGLASIFKYINFRRHPVGVIWLWTAGYLLLLSLTSAFPRYLLLIVPFTIILTLRLVHD